MWAWRFSQSPEALSGSRLVLLIVWRWILRCRIVFISVIKVTLGQMQRNKCMRWVVSTLTHSKKVPGSNPGQCGPICEGFTSFSSSLDGFHLGSPVPLINLKHIQYVNPPARWFSAPAWLHIWRWYLDSVQLWPLILTCCSYETEGWVKCRERIS